MEWWGEGVGGGVWVGGWGGGGGGGGGGGWGWSEKIATQRELMIDQKPQVCNDLDVYLNVSCVFCYV